MLLDGLTSISEVEKEALQHLPRAVRDYYAGGSGTETTLRRNQEAYRRYIIRPFVIRDVAKVDTTTVLFGNKYSFPIGIASTAFHKLADPEGEIATAKAAVATNTLMTCSTLSTTKLEDVMEAVGKDAAFWYQLYAFKNPESTKRLVERAVRAGFKALVLTVDTPVLGRRPADLRNAFNLPPHLCLANFEHSQQSMGEVKTGESAFENHVQELFNDSLTFEKLEWIAKISKIPLIVKGVMRGDDADQAIKHGAKAIIVSNHGGRQLDFAPSTIECLPEVVRAVNGRCPVFVDGGIRNGGDVFKAIALGAEAVFIGRPILWGLTLAGEKGVRHVLKVLQDEFVNTMLLAGCCTLAEIRNSKDIVVRKEYYSKL